MQVDHISLTLCLTLPEKIMQQHLPCMPAKPGEQLARVVHHYSLDNKLGYYPAIEFFRQVAEVDQQLIDDIEKIAWLVTRLAT